MNQTEGMRQFLDAVRRMRPSTYSILTQCDLSLDGKTITVQPFSNTFGALLERPAERDVLSRAGEVTGMKVIILAGK